MRTREYDKNVRYRSKQHLQHLRGNIYAKCFRYFVSDKNTENWRTVVTKTAEINYAFLT